MTLMKFAGNGKEVNRLMCVRFAHLGDTNEIYSELSPVFVEFLNASVDERVLDVLADCRSV